MGTRGQASDNRAAHPFSASHPADRNAVAIAVAVSWFGLLAGFIPEMLANYAGNYAYVPATHVHAASAVGWMLLLSTQAFAVRAGRMERHRMIGRRVAPVLFPVVVVSALVTVWMSDRVLLANGTFVPARLAFQVGHVIPFAVLTAIALLQTSKPDLHKRLMLLAVFSMLDTGWSRWIGMPIRQIVGDGLAGQLLGRFPLTWALIIAMGFYDRSTRGRLHPAFLPATAMILLTEFGAAALFFSPWWDGTARRLLGF